MKRHLAGEAPVIERNRRSFADLELREQEENILYEVESIRRLCGIRLEKVPEETTILNFSYLLEYDELDQNLLKTIKEHPSGDGLLPSGPVHGMETTSANVHDLSPSENLLHGEEACVGGMQKVVMTGNTAPDHGSGTDLDTARQATQRRTFRG